MRSLIYKRIHIILFLFVIINLVSCNSGSNVDNVILSKALNKELSQLIKENKAEGINDNVYIVYFESDKNNSYVTISSNYFYQKELINGYYFKDSSLVVFYFLDKLRIKNIINKTNLKAFKDSIPNYSYLPPDNKQYQTYPKQYKIINPDSLILINR